MGRVVREAGIHVGVEEVAERAIDAVEEADDCDDCVEGCLCGLVAFILGAA